MLFLVVAAAAAVAVVVAAAGAGAVPVTDMAKIAEILDEHNKARCEYGVAPLTWDTKAAQVAGQYADRCPSGHNGARHSQYGMTIGENIYWSGGMGQDGYRRGVASWNDEKRIWSCGSRCCNGATGHYTQNVWTETKKVGCGFKSGCGQFDFTFVCNYFPAGNSLGDTPFPASRCSMPGSFPCDNTSPVPDPPTEAPPPPPTPDANACFLEEGCECLGGITCYDGLDCDLTTRKCVKAPTPAPPTVEPPSPTPPGATPRPSPPPSPPTGGGGGDGGGSIGTGDDDCPSATESCKCVQGLCKPPLLCSKENVCEKNQVPVSGTWDPRASTVEGWMITCNCARPREPTRVSIKTRNGDGELVHLINNLRGNGFPKIYFNTIRLDGGGSSDFYLDKKRKRQYDNVDLYEHYANGIYQKDLFFEGVGKFSVTVSGESQLMLDVNVTVRDCSPGSKDCSCLIGSNNKCRSRVGAAGELLERLSCNLEANVCEVDTSPTPSPTRPGEVRPVAEWYVWVVVAVFAVVLVAVLVVAGCCCYVRRKEKQEFERSTLYYQRPVAAAPPQPLTTMGSDFTTSTAPPYTPMAVAPAPAPIARPLPTSAPGIQPKFGAMPGPAPARMLPPAPVPPHRRRSSYSRNPHRGSRSQRASNGGSGRFGGGGGVGGGDGDYAIALWAFQGVEADDLPLQKGERVLLLDTTTNANWWRGRNGSGVEGQFPANRVRRE